MDVYPLVPAYPKGRAVRETYACAFAEQHLLDEQCQRHGNFFFKLYKPVVLDYLREEMTHILADIFKVEMFQTTVARIMKQYHNQHDFCLRHG